MSLWNSKGNNVLDTSVKSPKLLNIIF